MAASPATVLGRLACVPGVGGPSPRQRAATKCARRGRLAVIRGCVDVLDGRDLDEELVVDLVGAPAEYVLSGHEGGRDGRWPRVWAARGLLHEWDDCAIPAVIRAVGDPAWRVREMALKVVARHCLEEALDVALASAHDPVERVRTASERAVTALTAAGA